MRAIILTTVLLTAACAHRTPATHEIPPPSLGDLAATYMSLQTADWTDTDRCDALLFNALRGASGVPVDVGAAEDHADGGRWYRRPVSLPECFAAGESSSTISRDMLLGVYWWAWTTDRADVVSRLWSYAVAHAGKMGDGDDLGVETVLDPNMIALLARLCTHLRADCGAGADAAALVPLKYIDPEPRGFVRHLEVLQLLLAGEIDGGLPSSLVARLSRHAQEQPGNPLFAAAAVLYRGAPLSTVEAALRAYPRDHLPTDADWCSAWPVEEESDGDGLEPCGDGEKVHSGGEILFLVRVLVGKE